MKHRRPVIRLQSKARQLVGFNKFLATKNDALKITVTSHKELLSTFLEKPSTDALTTKINSVIRTLETINHNLENDNLTLSSQLAQAKQTLETEEEKCSEEIDSLENKNFVLTNLLEKQDHVLADLEEKLKEVKAKDGAGGMRVVEKRVLDPTQQTLILHHELQACRNAFKKLTKGLNAEINKNTRLEVYSKGLREQNDFLVTVIKSLCVNSDKPTDNSIFIPFLLLL